MKNAKGEGGGKGWFVGGIQAGKPIYGRFDEGPQEGNLFRVEHPLGEKKLFKKGDKIKVLITSLTYGRVKFAK